MGGGREDDMDEATPMKAADAMQPRGADLGRVSASRFPASGRRGRSAGREIFFGQVRP